MIARALALIAAIAAAPGFAADRSGRFAIEGGGLQTCQDYLSALRWRTGDVAAYGGWIEGYLTAINQRHRDVYDLTPWQTTESLVSLLRSICRQLPGDTRVALALDRMVRLLAPQALAEESQIVAIRFGEEGTVGLYATVLDRINAALRDRGHAASELPGHFGADTEAGLRAVQAESGLPETGLPDQRTLFVLLLGADPVRPTEAATR